MIYAVLAVFAGIWILLLEYLDARLRSSKFSSKGLISKGLLSLIAILYSLGIIYLIEGADTFPMTVNSATIIGAAVVLTGLLPVVLNSRKSKRPQEFSAPNMTIYVLLIIAMMTIGLEATIFNFRYYQALTFEPVADAEMVYSQGLQSLGNNVFVIDEELGTPTITLNNINAKVQNIYINIDPKQGYYKNGDADSLSSSHVVRLVISATDEANVNPISFPEVKITDDVEGTKFINLNLSGKASSITLRFTYMNKREFTVKSIMFNRTPPFQFSLLRIGLVFLLLSFCYLVRPKSHFYNYDINFDSKYQRIAILAVAVVLAYGLVFLSWMNPYCNDQISSVNRSQYEKFSEMLVKGQIYFDYTVDPLLLEMENPYDLGARKNLKVEYKWDHAFYDGKYYMYFGIVPELLTFLPYRLLTGQNLPTYLSVSICLLLLVAGVMSLLYQIIRQYFKKAKLMVYLMLSITFILGSGITLAKYPTLYIVPIAFAVMLGVWGLNFWILAKAKTGQLKKLYLLFGSLLIALIFGCRPQVGLVFLAAIPIFWDETRNLRILFSRKGWLNTVALLLPFVLIGAGLMWYNFARFGSPFEFGAQYNLTTNDMTHRGFVLDRIPIGIFTFFFQLPVVIIHFPFFSPINIVSRYQGISISETTFGGVLLTFPVLLTSTFCFWKKQKLKEKGLYALCLLLIGLSFVIAIADIEVAGMLQRYLCDFIWLLFIAASIIWLSMAETRTDPTRSVWFYRSFSVAFVISVIYSIMLFFANEISSLSAEHSMSVFYYTISDLIEFWN